MYIHFLRLKNLSKGIIFINYFLLYIYIRQLQLYNLRNRYLVGLSSVRHTFPLPPQILHTIICEVCVSIGVQVWEHTTNLTPLHFIEVSVPTSASERSCICLLGVSIWLCFHQFSIRFWNCSNVDRIICLLCVYICYYIFPFYYLDIFFLTH